MIGHWVTSDDIRELAAEAGAAGDLEQARLCERALSGDTAAHDECVLAILATAARQAFDRITTTEGSK
jgi:hypothetical protein